MDALSCVGVAPQGALMSRSFADAAIARALRFSLSDAPEPSAAAASTTAALPAAAALMHAFGGHPPPGSAAPTSPARCRLGPAGGHAGKRRRPRPSKRAPTTYISTDAATFRVMVQRVTGADESDLLLQQQEDGAGAGLGLGLLLPQLGIEQFLQAGPAAHAAAAAAYTTAAPPAPAEQQPLFPTLDSWNVMYGKKNGVV
ncbi:uncharacterized protein LOC120652554 [Panicum virgatum]|uniref:VQ domain-containing protein n=1 Tax=Panicum virgatum TaxID=38727 RepID=A0A8T0NV04_PANVG|nr:uncharacterized protein LOC120652554 [Panicum virgatum]KAG2552335.1 hypothetical protein PVAP13_9KG424000 [Panicum virgatum]